MTGDDLKAARLEMNARPNAMAEKLGMSEGEYGSLERSDQIAPALAMAVQYMLEHPEDRPKVDMADVKVLHASDIDFSADELFDGRTWGPWRLSLGSLTLDLDSRVVVIDRDGDGRKIWERRESYYIMLPEVSSAKGAVDWLGQIAGKGWGPVTLGHLTQAFDDIFSFQGRFAHADGFGSGEATADYLRRVIKPRDDEELLRRRAEAKD